MTSAPMSMPDPKNEAAQRSDELVRLLVDSALEHAVLLLDREGRVTWWSRGAERVFSLSREQAIGMPVTEIFTPSINDPGSPSRAGDCRRGCNLRGRSLASASRWRPFLGLGRPHHVARADRRGARVRQDRARSHRRQGTDRCSAEPTRRSATIGRYEGPRDRESCARAAQSVHGLEFGLAGDALARRRRAAPAAGHGVDQQQLQIVRSLTEDLLDAERFRAARLL